MPVKVKSFWPAIGWLLFATILFCLPGKALPERTWFNAIFLDKWIHVILFAVLVILLSLPFFFHSMQRKKRFFIFISIAMNCFLYGVIIEIVQYYFIPNRSFDLQDMASDGIGCLAGWYFIRYYYQKFGVKKVCFYGPESTGKSTLAKHFANLYKTEFVPEVAREIVTSNSFSLDDIIATGKAQTERVIQKTKEANRILFCDTDLITTQIYSQHYLQAMPPILFELEKQVNYEHYLLFDIDTPWVADGMRDLGSDIDRTKMFKIFKSELEKRTLSYTIVRGNYREREKQVKIIIDKFIA
jgi:nicotinamide riboside kinase/VanZ family protein